MWLSDQTSPLPLWLLAAGRCIAHFPKYAIDNLSHFIKLRQDKTPPSHRIAAVVVGRNDDYMPNFMQRLCATIEWNTSNLALEEVVFVEWNPPAGRELLSLGLTQRFGHLRAYVVPGEVHQSLCPDANIALLEYHAKNVGIRRARAPWILVTNGDAAVAPDTIYNILHAHLSEDVIWTARRVDIYWSKSKRIGLMRSLCCRNFLPYHPLGTGEFVLASRNLWERAGAYDESLVRHRPGCDLRGVAQMLAKGAKIRKAGSILHLDHKTSWTRGRQPHHGELATWSQGLPFQNEANWGLRDLREVRMAERVWRLEP